METKRLRLEKHENRGDLTNTEVFSVCLKSNETKVGEISVSETGEISYNIIEPYAGNGYATEELIKIVDYSIKIGKEPHLRIRRKNEASKKVATKAGFEFDSLIEPVRTNTFELWKIKK